MLRKVLWAGVLAAAMAFTTSASMPRAAADEPGDPQAEQEQQAIEGQEGAEHAHAGHHAVNANELVWQWIDFTIVVAVLFFAARKPLQAFLENRHKSVAQALQEAQTLKAAAEAKQAEYQGRLDRLNQEIDALRAEMVKAGEVERDRIVAEAEAKAERMRKESAFIIEQQLKQLRIDLTKETVEAAVRAAQDVLTKEATAADQDRLATAYLERIGQEASLLKEKRA